MDRRLPGITKQITPRPQFVVPNCAIVDVCLLFEMATLNTGRMREMKQASK